jgi:hypothetical protein
MIKRWPSHVMTTRRRADKSQIKGLNDKLRRCAEIPDSVRSIPNSRKGGTVRAW